MDTIIEIIQFYKTTPQQPKKKKKSQRNQYLCDRKLLDKSGIYYLVVVIAGLLSWIVLHLTGAPAAASIQL